MNPDAQIVPLKEHKNIRIKEHKNKRNKETKKNVDSDGWNPYDEKDETIELQEVESYVSSGTSDIPL